MRSADNPGKRGLSLDLVQANHQAVLVHSIQPPRQLMGRADAGIASNGLQKGELGAVVPWPVIVVATIDVGGHRRGAARSEGASVVTETKSGPFHCNAEFVRKSGNLFPQHGREFAEHPLFGLNIEPPRESRRLAAEESPTLSASWQSSRALRSADLVRRAPALNDADAKRFCRNLHRRAQWPPGSSTAPTPSSPRSPAGSPTSRRRSYTPGR